MSAADLAAVMDTGEASCARAVDGTNCASSSIVTGRDKYDDVDVDDGTAAALVADPASSCSPHSSGLEAASCDDIGA